jgi:hypothetical protein
MVCAGLREWPAAIYGPDAAFISAAALTTQASATRAGFSPTWTDMSTAPTRWGAMLAADHSLASLRALEKLK